MEKIAFISGEIFIYRSSIILTLAALTAIALFAALYLYKSSNGAAICVAVPMAVFTSIVLGRLIHWYCRTDAYESLQAAMSDFSWGGYALMGVFAGCILTACFLRVLSIVKNLPEMFDCMALAGGMGIAVGRLASLFNSSDRGVIVAESWGLPFAYPVTNVVSGAVENRLATFMLQSVTTAVIVLALFAYLVWSRVRKNKVRDGDITLLFLGAYGACQVILDSTRYDSLFLRSNGFISIVQILGAVALALAVVVFSVRMVKVHGLKIYQFVIWLVTAAMLGTAGYMEYYVQRHGDQAPFAYSIMSVALMVLVILMVLIRAISLRPRKIVSSELAEEDTQIEEAGESAPAEIAEESEPAEETEENEPEEVVEEVESARETEENASAAASEEKQPAAETDEAEPVQEEAETQPAEETE